MPTRRRMPSLDDAGKMVYQLTCPDTSDHIESGKVYSLFSKDLKKHYVKLAIEIWREVEKCM